MKLYNEVKELMAHNIADYCAEENDERYSCKAYNKAVARFQELKADDLGWMVNPDEITDFNEMVAYLVVFEGANAALEAWQNEMTREYEAYCYINGLRA